MPNDKRLIHLPTDAKRPNASKIAMVENGDEFPPPDQLPKLSFLFTGPSGNHVIVECWPTIQEIQLKSARQLAEDFAMPAFAQIKHLFGG